MEPGPLHTPLCDLLGIRHPVLLAGMAGGPTTPELVAAVSRAGGLGAFGAMGMPLDALREAVARARALTDAPFGVNVLLAPPIPGNPDVEGMQRFLDRFREELGIDPPAGPPPRPPGPLELVEAGLEAGARVVAVGLGDPAPVVPLARAAGAPVIAMVATVEEARRAVASGADALVAQGAEAGGHRTSFEVDPDGSVPMVGTLALVPQVVDAVEVPVAAAGGIADGRGLAAALALGAAGAQVGTRFLLAAESGASPFYRRRLRAARETDTVVTRALSGRPARSLRSRLIEAIEREGPPVLGWPGQGAATADVRAAADRAGVADLTTHLAGQAAGLAGPEEGAEEIVSALVRDAVAVLRRLAG